MFGYIKPFTPELKLREYEAYRAVYCGLCRAMGKGTSALSRLTLSYDFVFLSCARLLICGEEYAFEMRRCFFHPFRRRLSMKNNPQLAFSAKAGAALFYHHVKDDIADSRGIKRILSRLLLPFAAYLRRRAKSIRPLDEAMGAELQKLYEMQTPESRPDALAEQFGRVTSLLFTYKIPEEKQAAAGELGRAVGKYIYLCDALDDFPKDRKTGAFNPFAFGNFDPAAIGNTLSLLSKNALAAAALCCDDDRKAKGKPGELSAVIDNILRLGLQNVARAVGDGAANHQK